MEYEVNIAKEDIEINPRREWYSIHIYKSQYPAVRRCIRESMKKEVFESEFIKKDDNGDVVQHSYYRKGVRVYNTYP